VPPLESPAQQQQQQSALSLFASIKDEYDPMRPNDYEEVSLLLQVAWIESPLVWDCMLEWRHGCLQCNAFMQVLKERERAKLEAEVEAERIARLKEMEVTMERLRKVSSCEQMEVESLSVVLAPNNTNGN
jgi:hypothetical protein